MTQIVPAIPPVSYEDLEERARLVKGLVSRIQIDVANGSYATSRTWPYASVDHFAELVGQEEGFPFWEDFEYEVDLLIKKPELELDRWIRAGISGAIVHIESTDDCGTIIDMAQSAAIELGWGIKPSTPNEKLFEIIETYGMPAFVQVMGNDRIGYQGLELDERVYEKIEEILARYTDLTVAVDIGVNSETAPHLIDVGVTKLVSTSAIFEAPNIKSAIQELAEAAFDESSEEA